MESRTKSRPVALNPADRELLTRITRAGSHPAQQVRGARILLETPSHLMDLRYWPIVDRL